MDDYQSDLGPANRAPMRPRKPSRTKHIKIALPLIVLALTTATVIWTFTAGEDIELQATAQILGAISKNELVNPRFESTDNKNQPFTITATKATRGETDDGLVFLQNPEGDILLESGRWIAVKASEGAYNQDKKRLILRNNVTIYDDQGYTMQTEEMNIDMAAETIASSKPVTAQGPAGSIKAAGLYNNSKTGILSFQGPATLSLTQKTNQSALGDLR